MIAKDSKWYSILEEYIGTDTFLNFGRWIANKRKSTTIYPDSKDVFILFDLLENIEDIKVLVLGQSPYPLDNHAMGVAFGTKQENIPASLKTIKEGLKHGGIDLKDNTLVYWVIQGVFMLNTSLTVEWGRPNSHKAQWFPFMKLLLTKINEHHKDLPVILVGNDAQEYGKYLDKQKIWETEHPAYSFRKGKLWNYSWVFKEINEYLESIGKTKINWSDNELNDKKL